MNKFVILLASLLLAPLTSLQAVEPIAAFTSGARILFQGDSITDGNRGRNSDPNHILGLRISEIFRFMLGRKMPVLRPGADSALKSCRRHDGEPAVERSDTAG
jgi:hypothetical protein